MKALFQGLVILMTAPVAWAGGSMVGGGDEAACTPQAAIQKAYQITDAIATANQFDLNGRRDYPLVETDGFYEVGRSYDQGLSVPTYTVRITKESCLILDVRYSNNEG